MTKTKWKKRIRDACEAAGTYKPFFDDVIETLAGIMENRDIARQMFDESGKRTTVEYTNKGGATNIVKNPALVVLMECDAQALAYWRDLGLTPAGYKRLTAEVVEKDTGTNLGDLLKAVIES